MRDVKQRFARRLEDVCDAKGVIVDRGRQTELAKLFDVTQSAARKWLKGEALPTLEKAIEIAIWGDVSLEWFLTGRGPRLVLPTTDDAAMQPAQIVHQLPDASKGLIVDMLTPARVTWCARASKPAARASVRRPDVSALRPSDAPASSGWSPSA